MNRVITIIKANPKTALLILFLCLITITFLILSILTLTGGSKEKKIDSTILTPEQQEQNKADVEYGQRLKTFLSNYPWYDSLPPKNSKYFVAFDDGESAFYVSLYSKDNPSLTEEYKKQVFLDLEKIGVATASFRFNWFLR